MKEDKDIFEKMFSDVVDSCEPTEIDFENGKLKDAVNEFSFRAKGIGFGQITFYKDKTGQLICDDECSGRDFVKRMLNVMVDKCILTSEIERE